VVAGESGEVGKYGYAPTARRGGRDEQRKSAVPHPPALDRLHMDPALPGWAWSFYISRDQADGISTKVALLDAEFWLCIRARL
jgi:hypothetical protein